IDADVAALGGDALNGAEGFDYAGEHVASRPEQRTHCMERTPVFMEKQGAADRRGNGRVHEPRASRRPALSHPDSDRRLRNHTGSADPTEGGRSRAWAIQAITAGGEFHPALRTLDRR